MNEPIANSSADSDEWLVRAAQRGDRTAFEQLIRKHARSIHARIALRSIPASRIDDLTQETFLLAWRRLKTLNDPKLFRAWLARSADGVVVDAIRHDRRAKRSPTNASLEGSTAIENASVQNEPNSLDAMVRDEEQAQALTALANLPEQYREPLILRYLGGLGFDEIADRLSISHGSLRGLLQRGMSALRESLPRSAARSTVTERGNRAIFREGADGDEVPNASRTQG